MSHCPESRSRILIVDDVPANIDVLARVLEADYELSFAVSGGEALSLLSGARLPDLILLDVMMPEMDGYEVCAALKAERATREIPVIFITAMADVDSETQALTAGAVDFIHKPFSKEVVRARVRLHVEMERRRAALIASESRARAFMNTAMDAVIVIDGDNRIVEFNPAGERMFGYAAEELAGQTVDRLMPADIGAQHGEYVGASDPGSVGMRMAGAREVAGRTKDGREFPVEVTVGVFGAPRERMYVGIVRDITERRRAEAQLARARERESEIAAAIQQRLLVRKAPDNLHGYAVACRTVPSQVVDGDFYTFTRLSPSCFEVLIADVMGKGVPAALLASGVKSAYRRVYFELMADLSERVAPAPQAILNALHAALTPELIALDSFVTMTLLRFDRESRTMTWVNAGHTPIMLARRGRPEVVELLGDNLPLGVIESERYEECTTPFDVGDTVMLYSDGVTDAVDDHGVEFGTERLKQLLARGQQAGDSAAGILDALREAVETFTRREQPRDDRTAVIVQADA